LLARFRVRVTVPQLRQRDRGERQRLIDFVAQHPLVNPASGTGKGSRVVTHIAPDALDALLAHEYRDGNFRELERLVHDAIWKARRANRRTVETSDLELERPRHRPDSRSLIVPVRAVPDTSNTVEVVGKDELLRLADRRNVVVLYDGGRFAAIADGVTYVATEGADDSAAERSEEADSA
jgi:transcriptional regulator with AAA-type ATPase domain